MLSSMRLCSNVPAQSVIELSLNHTEESEKLLLSGGRVRQQRDFIYKAINDIPGLSSTKPEAAFYIFPKIDVKRFNVTDDEKMVLDILREKHILLTHGGGFHWEQPDHFRIVYLPSVENLERATSQLAEFFADYKQN